ncbi:MAG: glutathione S-transferase [Proteobacteria bacterium]|nr:MAG: glutathione S-transferase [Pseudomonadota bacterium]
MQLRYSPTSPYVRKVRVLAIETRMDEVIDLVPTDPHDPDTNLGDVTPLAKVPALITDDGFVVFDSPVICEYLDGAHGGARLVPVATPSRWHVLRLQSIGDGIMDAAVGAVMEARRPEDQRSPDFVAKEEKRVRRAVTWLEENFSELQGDFNLGQISVACALSYLDFRLPQLDWRGSAPRLSAWHETVSQRDSMRQTAP